MDNQANIQPETMTPEQLAAIAADSDKAFTAEMAEPPKPAIGTEPAPTAGPTPPPAGGSMFDYVMPDKEPAGSGPAPEPEYKPFADDGPADTGSAKDKLSGMSLDAMLKLRHKFEAMLLAHIDGQAQPDDYMPDEFEMEMYREVYAPYKNVASDKLPPWLWILMVEVVFTGQRLMKALKNRKINIKNKKAAQVQPNPATPGSGMAAAAAKVVPMPGVALPGKRTNWKIFADGTYHYCRETASQKADYRPIGTHPVEKVDLTNLEDVKRVIHASGWPKLQKAFGLQDNWLQSKGIDINNLGLEEE